MNFDLLHPADQLVMMMERIYGYGMTTTSGGNLSIMDENGDVWITPGGIDKGSLTRKDIVRVTPDGEIAGIHKPSIELPFHQLVYRIRPDIRAILHAHPPALIAFSVVRKIPDISLVPSAAPYCGEVGLAEYALPGSIELGGKIAAVFAKGNNIIMLENHGVVVGGSSLSQAFMAFETLNFYACLEINARRLGSPQTPNVENDAIFNFPKPGGMDEFVPQPCTSSEMEARHALCRLIRRAYDQKLFTSTQGTFSQRLEKDAFIITPHGLDRKYLEPGDIARIENNRCEAGKIPSFSVALHREIYQTQPHVNSVIIAQAPNIMAFAVTDETLDTRIIPESYFTLLNISKLPYGAILSEPKKIAAVFTKNAPLALVKNDGLIVTGKNPLNCFDRLEVAEYSAKAVIAARSIGEAVMIDDEKIKEIEKAFGISSS